MLASSSTTRIVSLAGGMPVNRVATRLTTDATTEKGRVPSGFTQRQPFFIHLLPAFPTYSTSAKAVERSRASIRPLSRLWWLGNHADRAGGPGRRWPPQAYRGRLPARGQARPTGPWQAPPIQRAIFTPSASGAASAWPSGFVELDRVLGGGLGAGGVFAGVVGCDPGIGKSTLLLQSAQVMAQSWLGAVCEQRKSRPQQVKCAGDGLGSPGPAGKSDHLQLLLKTRLGAGSPGVSKKPLRPAVAIIEQQSKRSTTPTQQCARLGGPGARLRRRLAAPGQAPGHGPAAVGHVTKEGMLAAEGAGGICLMPCSTFRGDRFASHRFAAGSEEPLSAPRRKLGVFEMRESGAR